MKLGSLERLSDEACQEGWIKGTQRFIDSGGRGLVALARCIAETAIEHDGLTLIREVSPSAEAGK